MVNKMRGNFCHKPRKVNKGAKARTTKVLFKQARLVQEKNAYIKSIEADIDEVEMLCEDDEEIISYIRRAKMQLRRIGGNGLDRLAGEAYANRVLKEQGVMREDGTFDTYWIRTLAALNHNLSFRKDTAGKTSLKEIAVLLTAILALAAISTSVVYNEMHHDDNSHGIPMPDGDIYVQVKENNLEKIVTVSGNVTGAAELSGVEIELQKDTSNVFNETQALSGNSGKYNKEFNVTTKEPGTYKAIVKITDLAQKTKVLSKDFVLGDLKPEIVSASVDVSSKKVMIAYQDKDNPAVAASVAIVTPGTNKVVNGSMYDVFLDPKQVGNFTLDFSKDGLPDGKYELLVNIMDDSGKLSLEKRIPFELSSPVNNPPVIKSWDINSGKKILDGWINYADDSIVKTLVIDAYNSNVELITYTTVTPNNQSGNASFQLDLSTFKGDAKIKVKAIDDTGKESAFLEKLVNIPNGAPTVESPVFWYNATDDSWYVMANATDKDGFLDYIHIRLFNADGNVTISENSKPMNDEKGSYVCRNQLPHGVKVYVEVWATDKDGAISEKKYDHFIS